MKRCLLILVLYISSPGTLYAQASIQKVFNETASITYSIKITSRGLKTGIEETYNGGTKSVFWTGHTARVRLVSLMRIQSIFFTHMGEEPQDISLLKESGKTKYKYKLTNSDWRYLNSKYDNASTELLADSLMILDYSCRKVIITLTDGRKLTAWYSPLLKPLPAFAEPAFASVPGMVLQYEYEYGKGIIVYTADKISFEPIDPALFIVPSQGYISRKYCRNCPVGSSRSSSDNSIDF